MLDIDHLCVVCHKYFEEDGLSPSIGGVETYVGALSRLACEAGWSATVLQRSKLHFRRSDSYGSEVRSWGSFQSLRQEISAITAVAHRPLFIYSGYSCTPRKLVHPCVFLQHGVSWDYYATSVPGGMLRALNDIRKAIKGRHLQRRLKRIVEQSDATICVDTNFGNWLRACFPSHDLSAKLTYVPNFSPVPIHSSLRDRWQPHTTMRCLYPRRFSVIRGALLYTSVVQSLAREFPNVVFSFVGTGSLETEMRSRLRGLPNIEFRRVDHERMMDEYLRAHIVVIPTVASEGTSLSCVEAMASGCAVVATTVGGLPNLVLPGYNGLLCEPRAESLSDAIRSLLLDPGKARAIGENARRVAELSFSEQLWADRVHHVLAGAATRR